LSKDLILQNLNNDIHREFKTACSHYGLSMKEVLVRHMQNIINDYRKAKMRQGAYEISKMKGDRK